MCAVRKFPSSDSWQTWLSCHHKSVSVKAQSRTYFKTKQLTFPNYYKIHFIDWNIFGTTHEVPSEGLHLSAGCYPRSWFNSHCKVVSTIHTSRNWNVSRKILSHRAEERHAKVKRVSVFCCFYSIFERLVPKSWFNFGKLVSLDSVAVWQV